MPKASKASKKKNDKHADFSKAKFKLGKGKKAPSNATDTSFKARSIALPGQDALYRTLGGKTSEATTAQGLVLDEVIVRFRHPNAGVRREALGGMKEILGIGVEKDAGKVVRAVGGLVSDDDATVRKALVNFTAWYLPLLPESTLSPHLPVLLLQTSSALSHIFPDIRLDACKLVHVLIQHLPSYVVAAWPRGGSNILEGLRLAVGLGEEKGSSRLSAGSKLVLLRTMLAFILAALKLSGETEQGTFSGWRAMETKGKGKQRMVGVENVEEMREEGFVAAIRDWGMAEDKAAEWEIGRMGVDSNGDEGSSSDVLAVRPPIFMRADASQHLYLQLQPLLLSTFLESAPTAFSPSSTSTSASSTNTEDIPLGLCSVTASLTEALAHPTLSASSAATPTEEVHAGVSDFLRRMAPYFPIRALKPASTPNGLSPAFALSLSYANLTVLLTPRPPVLVFPRGVRREVGWRGRVRAVEEAWTIMRTQRRKVTGKGKVGGADAWALEEVAEWVVEILDALAPTLTSTAYSALLPIIWQLLVQPPPLRSSQEVQVDSATTVGSAFLAHLARQGSTSAIRSLGNGFIISLITIHETRHPKLPFFVPLDSALRPTLHAWLEGIPKTLWELGGRDERSTEELLRFLLDIGLRGQAALEAPWSLLDGSAFSGIAAKLAPYFYLEHPTKGAVPGPWTRLESTSLRKLGLDVAQVWGEWDEGGRLREAVGRANREVEL